MERSQVTTASVIAVAAGAALLGYFMWQRSKKDELSEEPVKKAAPAAAKDSSASVSAPTVKAPVKEPKPSNHPLKKPTFSWEKVLK